MAKELTMSSSLGQRSFTLNHAQRILVWQKNHPKIHDIWMIDGSDYIFDDATNELIRNPDKATDRKAKAPAGTGSK